MKVRKAVIPAAGMGTRFYPLTRAQPKEMLPLFDKPVIHYVVEEALAAELDEILIIVGKGKDAIINYFDKSVMDSSSNNASKFFESLPDIYFVRQREPLGLANAIQCAEKFVGDDPFVVLLGDTVYTTDNEKGVARQLVDKFIKIGKPVIAVEEVPREKIKDYGIISGSKVKDDLWLIKEAIEKPLPENAPSSMGITGLYAFQPEIFDYIRSLKVGRNNEYQLTDAINEMCKDTEVYGFKFEGRRYDIGTMDLWIKAFIDFVNKEKTEYPRA